MSREVSRSSLSRFLSRFFEQRFSPLTSVSNNSNSKIPNRNTVTSLIIFFFFVCDVIEETTYDQFIFLRSRDTLDLLPIIAIIPIYPAPKQSRTIPINRPTLVRPWISRFELSPNRKPIWIILNSALCICSNRNTGKPEDKRSLGQRPGLGRYRRSITQLVANFHWNTGWWWWWWWCADIFVFRDAGASLGPVLWRLRVARVRYDGREDVHLLVVPIYLWWFRFEIPIDLLEQRSWWVIFDLELFDSFAIKLRIDIFVKRVRKMWIKVVEFSNARTFFVWNREISNHFPFIRVWTGVTVSLQESNWENNRFYCNS